MGGGGLGLRDRVFVNLAKVQKVSRAPKSGNGNAVSGAHVPFPFTFPFPFPFSVPFPFHLAFPVSFSFSFFELPQDLLGFRRGMF